MNDIRFGTDGWRGVIAEDFTADNVRRAVRAIVSYLNKKSRSVKVIIGCDTRFMSGYFARAAAETACGAGAKAVICGRPVTTPILSCAVKDEGASGGIMITASHNPPVYNGIKFKAPYGGSAYQAVMAEIEALLDAGPAHPMPYEEARLKGALSEADFFPAYVKRIRALLDTERVRRSGVRAVLDCMHGSSGGYAGRLWEAFELETRVIRAGADPYFGGINPEPLEANLKALSSEVVSSGCGAGFAFDGDADRLGVVDGSGRFVMPYQVMSLLLLHLAKNRKMTGMVVKTVSSSTLIDRVADDLGLPVVETPVGFKHICRHMLEDDVLIGGEENGGLGIKGYIPERDGMLAALLLTEAMACEGKGLSELLARMDKKYGRLYHKRYDCKLESPAPDLSKSHARLKDAYRDFGFKELRTLDGVKLVMHDRSWVLFRRSGTEPVLRVYAESEDPVRTEKLIARGVEVLVG